MNTIFKLNYLIGLFAILVISKPASAQLAAHAGSDRTICPGTNALLGGSPAATGGLAPYTYSWSPAAFLSSTTISNPIYTAGNWAIYTLTVTDDTGAVATDQVIMSPNYIVYVNAGNDTSICVNSYALLGADMNITGAGITYSWSPATFLNSTTSPRPTSTPTSTITYTLTATPAGCPSITDNVTVTVIPTPILDAGPDTTINQGAVATLNASGGFYYAWSPQTTLTYFFTAHPNAEPIATTTYYLYGTDASNKCPAYDSVTVFVTPDDDIVIYNTFTPNNDGNNDTWYMGNSYKYSENKLEVFNRNGKLVYKMNGYVNNWDGRAFGNDLPAATYFYVLDLGDNKGIKHGTVTIVR